MNLNMLARALAAETERVTSPYWASEGAAKHRCTSASSISSSSIGSSDPSKSPRRSWAPPRARLHANADGNANANANVNANGKTNMNANAIAEPILQGVPEEDPARGAGHGTSVRQAMFTGPRWRLGPGAVSVCGAPQGAHSHSRVVGAWA